MMDVIKKYKLDVNVNGLVRAPDKNQISKMVMTLQVGNLKNKEVKIRIPLSFRFSRS